MLMLTSTLRIETPLHLLRCIIYSMLLTILSFLHAVINKRSKSPKFCETCSFNIHYPNINQHGLQEMATEWLRWLIHSTTSTIMFVENTNYGCVPIPIS